VRRAYFTVIGLVVVALPLSACGGRGGDTAITPIPVVTSRVGTGADKTWVIAPGRGDPISVVVFLHGLGDQAETTPVHHRPWLDHLARSGSYVLYPRYELHPGGPLAMKHAVLGTLAALRKVDPDGKLPLVLIGYSRGGGMAVEMAGLSPALNIAPKAVLGVLPADMEPPIDYASTPADIEVRFLVGDMDKVVGDVGARRLADQLVAAGFPAANIRIDTVHSPPVGFEATHLSVLSDSNDARRAYWIPADNLIAAVRG
jgi:predicted esterase